MVNGIIKILKRLRNEYIIGELNNEWRKRNKHNYTTIERYCDCSKISVGRFTYGPLHVHDFDSGITLTIGNFCSIADDVHFYLAGNHELNRISSYPFKKNIFNGPAESLSKGSIVVEDDVWIGSRVIIMSGVRLNRGCVVAAGSIVTHDVAPYTIVGGVPAKEIKKRFNCEICKELEKIDFSRIDYREVNYYLKDLYQDLSTLDTTEVKDIVRRFLN